MNAADAARSILACPDGLTVIVDGVPQSLEDAPLGVQDWCGTPMFVCQADGELSRAGARRGKALLSVDSALADDESLLLVGRLRRAGSDVCPCCDARSDVVVLDLADVVLSRAGQRQAIAVRDFVDPALQLNTGYLLRSQEHVNLNHAEHLRLAVARQTSTRASDIVAAQLVGLTPSGVEVQWVSREGANRTELRFAQIAQTSDELGTLLRATLQQ